MERAWGNERRATSELIGVVLLFAFVFTAATFTFYFGMQATDTIREQTELETAERNMEEVKNELATVAASNGDDVTEISLDTSATEDAEIVADGSIVFQVNSHPDCRARMEVGSIVYENDRGTVAYQAGGVWKRTGNGSTMVSSPGLSYQTEVTNGQRIRTITFPMVSVSGDLDDSGDTVRARRNATMSQDAQRQLEESMCMRGSNTSKITHDGAIRIDNITIRIQNSSYYEAWGRYLQDEFGDQATVTVYDTNQTVVVEEAPLGRIPTDMTEAESPDEVHHSALYSTGNAGSNTVLKQTDVDSFNSSAGSYSTSQSDEGSFVVDGDVVVDGQVTVEGTVIADGDVEIDSNSNSIQGDVVHNGSVTGPADTTVTGEVIPNASIDGADPVTDRVRNKIDHLASGNHTNWRTDAIESRAVNDSGGEIGPGQYYVDDFVLDNSTRDQTVTLNTTGGELIVIGVGGDFDISDGNSLEIVGDGQVVFYVNDSITVSENSSVTIENDKTWRNWMYCTANCDVTVKQTSAAATPGTTFTGVVYAPTDGDTGSMTVKGSVAVYGALVGGELTFEGPSGDKADFHFDEALLNTNPPEVSLGTTDGAPGDGDDGDAAIDETGDSPNGTLSTNETVTVNGTSWRLESFDVNTTLLGTELSGIYTVSPFALDYYSVDDDYSDQFSLNGPNYWEQDVSELDRSWDSTDSNYTYETFTLTAPSGGSATETEVTATLYDTEGTLGIEIRDKNGDVVVDNFTSINRSDSDEPSLVYARFDAQPGEEYTVKVYKEKNYISKFYQVTVSKGRTITNTPIQLALNAEKDGNERSVEPWPDVDPGNWARDNDTNWPTAAEVNSHTITDLKGGTNFSVTAKSYKPLKLDYTGNTESVNGETMYDLGATSDNGTWVNISVDGDSNVGNVKILRDGDKVPNVEAGGDEQRSFEEMLGPYVNESGHLQLNDRQVVFLFELSEEDTKFEDAFNGGSDPDYNDAVLLYEFENFQWSCMDNCSSVSGDDSGDGSDTSVGTEVDNTVRDDDNGPQDNNFVIRITNSQVVVDDDDDDS